MAHGKRTSVWTFVAFIPATIGAVLTIVATTTHYWVESFTERRTGVDSMGLWEICFGNDFAAPYHVQDVLGRRYADCNYLLSYELRTLRSWLFPNWFIIVEVLMSLALTCQLLSLVFSLVYLLQGCFLRQQHFALLLAGLTNFSAGLMIATAAIVYGYYAGYDEFWLPSPESNHLSWSYGLCVGGGVFAIVAAMFQIIDFSRLQVVSKLESRAETYAPSSYRGLIDG
ncbi:uncharacterized protein [Littorina saxatilis]|uniref:Uncharacterized protein n=1 Tax=Littorina saxatilis TaxID=31220 RepID=A0AAN9G2T0_9CAEN